MLYILPETIITPQGEVSEDSLTSHPAGNLVSTFWLGLISPGAK